MQNRTYSSTIAQPAAKEETITPGLDVNTAFSGAAVLLMGAAVAILVKAASILESANTALHEFRLVVTDFRDAVGDLRTEVSELRQEVRDIGRRCPAADEYRRQNEPTEVDNDGTNRPADLAGTRRAPTR